MKDKNQKIIQKLTSKRLIYLGVISYAFFYVLTSVILLVAYSSSNPSGSFSIVSAVTDVASVLSYLSMAVFIVGVAGLVRAAFRRNVIQSRNYR